MELASLLRKVDSWDQRRRGLNPKPADGQAGSKLSRLADHVSTQLHQRRGATHRAADHEGGDVDRENGHASFNHDEAQRMEQASRIRRAARRQSKQAAIPLKAASSCTATPTKDVPQFIDTVNLSTPVSLVSAAPSPLCRASVQDEQISAVHDALAELEVVLSVVDSAEFDTTLDTPVNQTDADESTAQARRDTEAVHQALHNALVDLEDVSSMVEEDVYLRKIVSSEVAEESAHDAQGDAHSDCNEAEALALAQEELVLQEINALDPLIVDHLDPLLVSGIQLLASVVDELRAELKQERTLREVAEAKAENSESDVQRLQADLTNQARAAAGVIQRMQVQLADKTRLSAASAMEPPKSTLAQIEMTREFFDEQATGVKKIVQSTRDDKALSKRVRSIASKVSTSLERSTAVRLNTKVNRDGGSLHGVPDVA